MASKKPRQRKPHPSIQTASRPVAVPAAAAPANSSTAIQAERPLLPASTAVAESAKVEARVGTAAVIKPVQKAPESSRTAVLLARIPKILGSLQMAVILLALFAGVVFLGTWMEHAYGTKIAQGLVYRAWWFDFLLLMLAVNIFFAAAKKAKLNKEPLKLPEVTATSFFGRISGMVHQVCAFIAHFWPWKRHQFGFIVTHIGLLTMLFGGILNGLFGVDAFLQLVDTRDPDVQARLADISYPSSNNGADCVYNDIAVIKATELKKAEDGTIAAGESYGGDFWGGPFPWVASAFGGGQFDWLLWTMNGLESPLGRSWWTSLGNGATLEVMDFLPMARREEFTADDNGLAALKIHFHMQARMMADSRDLWLSFNPLDRESQVNQGPLLITTVGNVQPEMVKEFLQPPAPDQLGEQGVLVVFVEGRRYTVPVATSLDSKVPLGKTGWAVKLRKYESHGGLPLGGHRGLLDLGPTIQFELWEEGQKKAKLQLSSGLNGGALDLTAQGGLPPHFPEGVNGNPSFWFHPAEIAPDQGQPMGVLQFVQGTGGKIYYRSFTRADKNNPKLSLETSGEVDLVGRHDHRILNRANGRFRVVEFLSHAKHKVRYEPVYMAPGKATEMDMQKYPSVIRCRITAPDQKQPTEFWLPRGGIQSNLDVDKRVFRVAFTGKTRPLGFKVQLERAERTNDPGTGAPATYSSYVLLTDPQEGIYERPEEITMNQPLHHRGYALYQSSLEPTPWWDNAGRPVTISGFSVGFDPGLPFKYAGSIMLALGIAIMFYMRAYFFKPRRRMVNPIPVNAAESS
jgi:hypothetical protein